MRLARGLGAIRIFFGLVFFLNGLAKVVNTFLFDLGPLRFTLISRDSARNILEGEVNGPDSRVLPGVKWIVNEAILPNFGTLQWALTAAEIAMGVSLLLGLAARAGAALGAVMQVSLNLMVIGNFKYLFEYPIEWLPLAVLAVVPAGRVWGLDRTLAARYGDRWPF